VNEHDCGTHFVVEEQPRVTRVVESIRQVAGANDIRPRLEGGVPRSVDDETVSKFSPASEQLGSYGLETRVDDGRRPEERGRFAQVTGVAVQLGHVRQRAEAVVVGQEFNATLAASMGRGHCSCDGGIQRRAGLSYERLSESVHGLGFGANGQYR
jgi:hypothetical protein